jgi:hypothetical protein
MQQIGPNIYSEIIATIIVAFCYNKLKGCYMQWFIPFLAFTFLTEVYAFYLGTIGKHTFLVYAIYNPLSIIFYTYIFAKIALTNAYKKLFIYSTVTYIIVSILYYIIFKNLISSHYLILVSSIEITIFACLLFFQYLKIDDPESIANYKSNLWIIAGLLIFYSGIAIVLSLLYYIKKNELKIGGLYLFNFVPQYLSIILYGCISYACIVWKKSTQK